MEQPSWSFIHQGEMPKQSRTQELPVKVDIVDGADGLELHEIIFALQQAAQNLRDSDEFRARYMDELVTKYQFIQRKRLLQIIKYFQE